MDAAIARARDMGAARPSPLARGLVWRLGWAAALATLLWLGVWWALA